MLIFEASPGTLVLIDEPEISLHAAWKHAFLSDIQNVAELNDLHIIMATHSSGISHGTWDITLELSPETPKSESDL
jgi:predicted ATP-binding protein involved in virulence